MDETILALKPGVTLTEQDGKTGLTLWGHTQFAKDARQTEILRALVLQSQPPQSLLALFRALDVPQQSDNDISLIIAEFILDFGEFLES